MSSPLLTRSSSDSCSFLLSSFSASESSPADRLANLPPPSAPSDELDPSAVSLFEQDPVIPDLAPPPFLTLQANTSLDILPLDIVTTVAAPSEQVIGPGIALGSSGVPALGISSASDVISSHCDGSMTFGSLGASLEIPILQESQISTPTMHPNLVSTLKSIICPLTSSEQDLNLPPQESVFDMAARAPPCSSSSPNSGFPQIQTLYASAATSALGIVEKTEVQSELDQKEHQHAAIVPIYLIQNRRPYRCNYGGCNKTFKNPQTLKMHHKTHCSSSSSPSDGTCSRAKALHPLATTPQSCKAGQNKKIPSRCPICKRAFVGLYELRRHFGRKHSEGEKAHACVKCGKRFYIEVDLRDHQKLCGEPLLCKCGMKFAFKCNLVAHKKTHPMCQDEHEQQKYQQIHGTRNKAANSKARIENSKEQGHNKSCFTADPAESRRDVPRRTNIRADAPHFYASQPHYSSARSQMFQPTVKSEHVACSPWLTPPILGVSQAM